MAKVKKEVNNPILKDSIPDNTAITNLAEQKSTSAKESKKSSPSAKNTGKADTKPAQAEVNTANATKPAAPKTAPAQVETPVKKARPTAKAKTEAPAPAEMPEKPKPAPKAPAKAKTAQPAPAEKAKPAPKAAVKAKTEDQPTAAKKPAGKAKPAAPATAEKAKATPAKPAPKAVAKPAPEAKSFRKAKPVDDEALAMEKEIAALEKTVEEIVQSTIPKPAKPSGRSKAKVVVATPPTNLKTPAPIELPKVLSVPPAKKVIKGKPPELAPRNNEAKKEVIAEIPQPEGISNMEYRSILEIQPSEHAVNYRYSDEELQEFKDLILARLETERKELSFYQGLISRKDDSGTEDTDNRYSNFEDGSGGMER
ncbi:MAG: hypothetical protein EBX41_08415, partial [Chitinophagia bacterium]|nr:hypothetical protein [Chitinophagia bacterium]